MNTKKNTNLGKKIAYSLVIGLSALIILLSAIGVIGVWIVQRPVSETAVAVLEVVENSASVLRQSSSRADQTLAALETRTVAIEDASRQISQNVSDQGLVMTLLPAERGQELADTAASVRDTYNGIRESIAQVLDLYRSIDRIPFVNLPGLSDDQMENIESSLAQTQAQVEALRSQIADLRAGMSGAIDKVQASVNLLTEEIRQARAGLAQLDSQLAALEALSIRLQATIRGVLTGIALTLSLIFAFLIFTQVEVIRLYVGRWRLLENPQTTAPSENGDQPSEADKVSQESE
jgi:uncharacterized phage infection (PIP) family protein YhgE